MWMCLFASFPPWCLTRPNPMSKKAQNFSDPGEYLSFVLTAH